MAERRWRLYWCTTDDHHSDGWLIARSSVDARFVFGKFYEFPASSVHAEPILPISDPPPPSLVGVLDGLAPTRNGGFLPMYEHLDELGLHFNVNFHVYYYRGRLFRPDGLQRALRASRGLAYLMQQRKPRTRARPL